MDRLSACAPSEGYRVDRLDPSRHDRSVFSCGTPALDDFLRRLASQNQGNYISSTHILTENNAASPDDLRPIVGFVTLVNAQIPLGEIRVKLKWPSTLPAILVARMAVDERHKKKRLGEFLLRYSLVRAWEISQMAGCCAVFVDAKNSLIKEFYKRYGFIETASQPLRLYLPMNTIASLFA